MQKIMYRGVFKGSGWIFVVWGVIVALKGFYDAFLGLPESEFVTLAKWTKYAGFEIVYGLACIVVGLVVFEFSKRIPEVIERE
ncbi:MAG: hypothetical protein PHE88_00500 [Elusimicrobia bacterium]|nr:hypothetical protein [Elusimicrobiota bacterium]